MKMVSHIRQDNLSIGYGYKAFPDEPWKRVSGPFTLACAATCARLTRPRSGQLHQTAGATVRACIGGRRGGFTPDGGGFITEKTQTKREKEEEEGNTKRNIYRCR